MATTTAYAIGGANTNALGNAEDVLDIIVNISPKDTPLLTSMNKGVAAGIKHEWVYDSLRAAAANAAIEGAPATFSASAARARDYNYTQILRNTISVSESQRQNKKVAIDDELAYQVSKELPAHALDVEYMLIRNASRVLGDAATARQAGGITVFIDGYSGGTGNTTDKATAPFNEDEFNAAIQNAWDDGGMVDTVMCCGRHKRRISKFTAGSTKNVEAGSKALTNAIDVYDSDFGRVKMIANRNIPYTTSADVYFLDMKRWKFAVFRPTRTVPIATTGDSTERMIVTEATLEGLAPAANACIKAATDDIL